METRRDVEALPPHADAGAQPEAALGALVRNGSPGLLTAYGQASLPSSPRTLSLGDSRRLIH